MNDAKVAIELQPHFPKAFVRGKSFNSYKTFKSLVSDTTDVWGYKPWTYGIPQGGGGGGQKIFGGISNFFWKGKRGDLPKFLTDEGGRVAIFFLLLSKKEALFLDFFLNKKGNSNYSMLEERFLARFINNYTLHGTFITNITVKCFYCKLVAF